MIRGYTTRRRFHYPLYIWEWGYLPTPEQPAASHHDDDDDFLAPHLPDQESASSGALVGARRPADPVTAEQPGRGHFLTPLLYPDAEDAAWAADAWDAADADWALAKVSM